MQPLSWEVTLVRVESPFTMETAYLVKEQLTPLLGRPGDIVLDLRAASLDSAGLGAVLCMQRQLELRERRLLVVATDPQFLGLMERAGVKGALPLFADAGKAVDSVLGAHPQALAA